MRYTDTQMLDFLQKLNNHARYTGKCILRWSSIGRGWRLMETSTDGALNSVRETISKFMDNYDDTPIPKAHKEAQA